MLGIALEGGGAKAAFHMGVVKAFLEEGYEFGGITGTSFGAFNGAMIAQGDFDAGYRLWENMNTSQLFDFNKETLAKIISKHIDKETFFHFAARVREFIENKGIDASKIRQMIENIINEDKLRKSPVDFGLVTVSISELKPLELYKEDIPQGKIPEYIMASANFPGLKIKPIEGKYYLDGGLYDNCPVNLLARKGYREIIAVRTLSIGVIQEIKYPNVKVTSVMPSEDLGNILNFDNNLIRRNLKMGYYDAMRTIKGLKGRKYYIYPHNEEFFLQTLCSMPNESIYNLGELLDINEMDPKRMMFEKIIPALTKILGIKGSASYQDIVIALCEKLAEESGVEKYKIYSFGDFLAEVKKVSVKKFDKHPKILSKKHVLEVAAQKILDTIT
ncbi:MAG: patatin-like phospholipase family protein [Dehalobacterium sp.]